jgi:recombination protein RecA
MARRETVNIAEVLADIAKKHDLPIGSMSEVVQDITWLTTGNIGIDYVAGYGLPRGRSVELYGPPSSGKTTTGLQTAAAYQRRIIEAGLDEHILYLDFEHALDAEYCANLGLDVEHPSFLLAQPHSMEQGAEAALRLIETGRVGLSIWDSVAAMAPLARIEGEFDQRTAAMNKARLMSGLMLQLTPLLHKTASCGVFINHLMEAVEMTGRPGMPPKSTTPGGKALKYYASVRLEYKQIKNVKGRAVDNLSGDVTDQAVATHVRVKCTKNKLANPFREAEVRVRFGAGFDNVWTALQILLAHKRVMRESSWFRFDRTKVPSLIHPKMILSATGRASIQGEAGVLAFADNHADWARTLVELAQQIIEESGSALTDGTIVDLASNASPSKLDDALMESP